MAKNEKESKKNSYFKEMKTELKKVVWPTPKELLNNTVAVITFVIILALIVFVFDSCFNSLNKYGIVKLQEKIQSSFKTEEENNNNDNAEEQTEEQPTEEQSTEENENVEENNTQGENTVELENATVEQSQEVTQGENSDNQTGEAESEE